MHDPMVVAFEIRRPWPRRRRLVGRRYWPALITIWHVEPNGHDSGEVCKHSHRWQEPDGTWPHPVRIDGRDGRSAMSGVDREALARVLRDADHCHGIVTRDGEQDACGKPPVAIVDGRGTEAETYWPVCAYHAHRYGAGRVVPLAQVKATARAEAEAERDHWKRVGGHVREQAEAQQARAEQAEAENQRLRDALEGIVTTLERGERVLYGTTSDARALLDGAQ